MTCKVDTTEELLQRFFMLQDAIIKLHFFVQLHNQQSNESGFASQMTTILSSLLCKRCNVNIPPRIPWIILHNVFNVLHSAIKYLYSTNNLFQSSYILNPQIPVTAENKTHIRMAFLTENDPRNKILKYWHEVLIYERHFIKIFYF